MPDDTLLQKLADIARERRELADALLTPEVAADHRKVRELSIRKAALDPVADAHERIATLASRIEEAETLIASGAEGDDELAELARTELDQARAQRDQALASALEALVNADDRAVASVMLEIRAGVGGDEAGLWAADLLAMYHKFADRRKWSCETLSLSEDPALGAVRAAVLNLKGEHAWEALQQEAGTHCVKRVPATETQGRIHTSTATVAVLPEPEQVDFQLDESQVREHVTTAQGPGGQNVNKVATAVHLIHEPTGIEVRMQETKSQAQNREKAWRLLRARLYERELQRKREEQAAARSAQIGDAGRAERIRTYRYKEGIAVDHRLGESFPLDKILAGELDDLAAALHRRQTAERLAAL